MQVQDASLNVLFHQDLISNFSEEGHEMFG
jgi:hypothetical protein